jgi:hypothetical protein
MSGTTAAATVWGWGWQICRGGGGRYAGYRTADLGVEKNAVLVRKAIERDQGSGARGDVVHINIAEDREQHICSFAHRRVLAGNASVSTSANTHSSGTGLTWFFHNYSTPPRVIPRFVFVKLHSLCHNLKVT